jgi:dihydroorotase
MYDLLIREARVVDPGQGLDAISNVAFVDGKVAALGDDVDGQARDVRNGAGLIVVPGLIDLHTHIYWGATSISIDAEQVMERSGTTTFVDAGSAGPGNFPGFRKFIAERAASRVLAFLNVSFPGIYAYSKPVMVGECADLRLLDPSECVRVINENRDLIVGVKVRLGKIASGDSGIAPLEIAMEAAEETGLPIMAHIDNPPPSRREVLSRLRRGDILTHCFKPFPNTPIRSDGEIWEEVLVARERGVVFDLGHGGASFGFDVAEKMLAKGFVPDVISSDVHALNVHGPVYDLLTTLSKFHVLGLDFSTLIATATCNVASALRRPELGSLRVGAAGDATLLAIEKGSFDFVDCFGKILNGGSRLAAPQTEPRKILAEVCPGLAWDLQGLAHAGSLRSFSCSCRKFLDDAIDDHERKVARHSHAEAGEAAKIERMPAHALINVRDAGKTFATRSGETVTALDHVQLSIADGEFVSIVGPSGCGKTTLLRVLAGLETLTSGEASIDGHKITKPGDEVAVVFQQATLLPWYTVEENVLLPVRLHGTPKKQDFDHAHELLSLSGLDGFARKYPFELSGGMQQRVSICRALIRNPKILLMDEPFGALDAMTRESMNLELMRLWAQHKKTVVFITHSIPEAVLLGDRVVVMSPRPGRITQIFDVDIARPRSLKTLANATFAALCDDIRSIFGATIGSEPDL